MKTKQIGIGIGKNTFHLIGLGADGNIVLRRQFTRSRLVTFFEEHADEHLDVAFEACSGAHWLAHQLVAKGHDVRLLTLRASGLSPRPRRTIGTTRLPSRKLRNDQGAMRLGSNRRSSWIFRRFTMCGNVS